MPKPIKTVEPSRQSHHETAGPAQKQKQLVSFDLVRQILDLTNDHKSKAFWIKLVRHVDPETVCYLISSLRLAMSSGQVESPGKYLVGICRRVCPWVFEIPSKKQAVRPSQHEKAGHVHVNPCQIEPVEKPDFEAGLLEIRKIRMKLEGLAA